GIGVAACLMASLRTFGLWLAPAQLPAVNGYMLAVGNAGAIASTAPVLWLLGFISWPQMFAGIGIAALAIAAWLAFRVPDPLGIPARAAVAEPENSTGQRASWRLVLGHRAFWLLIPTACLNTAIGLAVQGLWAGPWLIDVAGIEQSRIGRYLLLVPAGMLLANLLLGRALTAHLGRGGSALRFAALACLIAPLGQLPFLASWTSLPALAMLGFGLTHVFGNLAFAALAPEFPREVAGRLVTTVNFIMFYGSFLLQWGMGLVINRFPADEAGRYLPAGYESAFLLLLLLQAAAAVWTLIALRRLASPTAHEARG
ncbi:MAG: MFS transporter, partial [Casimicrobiaceae bacterium]